jgi:hypothetical protein
MTCPKCNKNYKQKNWFGIICSCGEFLPPEEEFPIIKDNKQKQRELFKEALELIKRKSNGNNK